MRFVFDFYFRGIKWGNKDLLWFLMVEIWRYWKEVGWIVNVFG